MKNIQLISRIERLTEMTSIYGQFDLDINTGRPTTQWERRNLHSFRLPFPVKACWFEDFWMRRVQVNRRASEALNRVFQDLILTYEPEYMKAHGLDQFVRCYAFGASEPSLFWYGAGWELSPQVNGETLVEVVKIFVRNGWTYCGATDKKRSREFEYW